MNQLTKLLFFSLPVLAFAGCDTTEEAFSVGDPPKENEILRLGNRNVSFKPEGGSQDIQISSIARWEISGSTDSQFSLSKTSGKGTETVTVTCLPNSGQNSVNSRLIVSTANFNKTDTIFLSQSSATFLIDVAPSSEPTPEYGGDVTMTAYSSLAWKLEPVAHDADGNIGDPDWLDITPGLSGEGSTENKPINFRFKWKPNYTETIRTVCFQFIPTGMSISGLPLPFTLTQLAGTRPEIKACNATLLNEVDVDVKLEYASASPVKNCGIRLYKEGVAAEIATFTPEAGELLKDGNYSFQLRNLYENASYRIVPFVENQVGLKEGESCHFTTLTKPENIEYRGVSIINVDDGVVEERSASLSFTVMSDVSPLGDDRISRVTVTVDGKPIDGNVEKTGADTWRYSYSVLGLEPNYEYSYLIEVTGKDLPEEQGNVLNNTAKTEGSFKTKGLAPADNDNNRPNYGT